MTVERRSTSFFSALEDVLDDDGDDFDEEEDEEAHLGLDPPRATSAVDLRIRDHDLGHIAAVRASRVAMFVHEWTVEASGPS
jgi:hypothetical protein